MTDIMVTNNRITAMTSVAIDKVNRLTDALSTVPNMLVTTDHVVHGGMYARTILMPKDTVMTGALIKVPTILIVSGHATVWMGNECIEVAGYKVFAASAHRKQAFVFHEDTQLTMLMHTESKTIHDIEAEFTDEADSLMSRKESAINNIDITGE